MKQYKIRFAAIAATLAATLAMPAHAANPTVIISEVDAFGSSAAYAADWFELTNTGSATVSLSGWKMDDNSNSFSSAVALRGVTSLAAGQSAIFLESNTSGSTDASIDGNFVAAWFGASAPAGLAVGNYGGSGVGLSTSSDAVNVFDNSGSLVTRVDFGASSSSGHDTFDNASGLNNTTISQLSAVGVNGAFVSFNAAEIGSPGTVSAVPEPDAYALMLAGLSVMGFTTLRRKTA